ncbi:MAG: hypothetical protein JWO95_2016, partial [Verrucomicrobiales bacterium]|nr:hypothetical protein [Verrucomicrobiales bacterium]
VKFHKTENQIAPAEAPKALESPKPEELTDRKLAPDEMPGATVAATEEKATAGPSDAVEVVMAK